MTTTAAKEEAPLDAGDATDAPAMGRSVTLKGVLLVGLLIVLLVVLEVLTYQIAGSQGSPSWRAGYVKGHRAGQAAFQRVPRPPITAGPPKAVCAVTPGQLSGGVKAGAVVVGPHSLNAGDYRNGCEAGFRVALSNK